VVSGDVLGTGGSTATLAVDSAHDQPDSAALPTDPSAPVASETAMASADLGGDELRGDDLVAADPTAQDAAESQDFDQHVDQDFDQHFDQHVDQDLDQDAGQHVDPTGDDAFVGVA
jgi:hypothetical protein